MLRSHLAVALPLWAAFLVGGSRIAAGTWGGLHLRLEVTQKGAKLEYDCAHGTIDAPLAVDADGRFEAEGTHVPDRGGPIRKGEKPPGQAASYRGRVVGKTLTLSVALTDTKESLGTFTVTRGKEAVLRKCY